MNETSIWLVGDKTKQEVDFIKIVQSIAPFSSEEIRNINKFIAKANTADNAILGNYIIRCNRISSSKQAE